MMKLRLTEEETQLNRKEITLPDEERVWKKVYDEDVRYSWKITEELIKKLREEITSNNADLLVFYVPPKFSIYNEYWIRTKKQYGISDESWSPNQVGTELAAICKRNEINFFDPTNLFREKASDVGKKGDGLYFKKDGHWNSLGHQFAGKILADYVISRHGEEPKKVNN